jgi:ribosomal protein S18 acetylase RimI-like enzyme
MFQSLRYRWMNSADMRDVVALDCDGYPPDATMPEEKMRAWLRRRGWPRVGVLAECCDPDTGEYLTVAFALYSVRKGLVHLLRFSVASEARRQGVGRRLFLHVCKRAAIHHARDVQLLIPETNMPALQFARACGVRVTGLKRNHVGDGVDYVQMTAPRIPVTKDAARQAAASPQPLF